MNTDKPPTAENTPPPSDAGKKTIPISRTTHFCIVIICLTFLISGLILTIAIQQETQASHERNLESLNAYFTAFYDETIRPAGEAEMTSFISGLAELPAENDTARIEQIAAFAASNVTNEFWEEAYGLPSTRWRHLDPYTGAYVFNTEGKLRALPPSPYAKDPYWFLWYRMGACSELAALTAFVADKAGYEARVVKADLTPGLNAASHSWAEVRVNGVWWVVDADLYAQYQRFGRDSLADDWYTLPAVYRPYSPEQVTAVYLTATGESVTDRYPAIASG
ncbi:transglutaminase domain-containing protein [Methanogenium sp. S4BF]|uniref:transglutaminase domain-containing protein n=1 Tax=Methanogenium sp. S4BF TaxID=1789226 RepID=UPI00241772F3|nr:transglutaminase domain-containing protein [Methanogenium sp. S4BF]WFN34030.1 transglutaminase domain-containing protein [Methanogenium sp. S4BF]